MSQRVEVGRTKWSGAVLWWRVGPNARSSLRVGRGPSLTEGTLCVGVGVGYAVH